MDFRLAKTSRLARPRPSVNSLRKGVKFEYISFYIKFVMSRKTRLAKTAVPIFEARLAENGGAHFWITSRETHLAKTEVSKNGHRRFRETCFERRDPKMDTLVFARRHC